MVEKHDFREEVALTASQEISLKYISGKLGLSKSATLRFALIQLVEQINRKDRMADTGLVTED